MARLFDSLDWGLAMHTDATSPARGNCLRDLDST